MNRVIGMGCPNGPGDISDLLDLGVGSFLIVHGDHGLDQARQIRQRYPDALIYVRRVGGIGSPPKTVARECAHVLSQYAQFGVRDIIGYNEPDRIEEGGYSSFYIAGWAQGFLGYLREYAPNARIHWPALAHLPRYQGNEPDIWLPVARQFDVCDFHAYHDPGWVRTFFQFFATFVPGKPAACTEYNWGPGNEKPSSYGDWLYEAYRIAVQEFPETAESVCPFIFEWHGPEPGVGTSLDIRRDDDAKVGIRRAVSGFSGTVPPPLDPLPEPEEPAVNQAPWGPENTAKGWDCYPASVFASLKQRYAAVPTLDQYRAILRQVDPTWHERKAPALAASLETFRRLGVTFERLPSLAEAGRRAANGQHPVIWMEVRYTDRPFLHAANLLRRVKDHVDRWYTTFWDAQHSVTNDYVAGAFFGMREYSFVTGTNIPPPGEQRGDNPLLLLYYGIAEVPHLVTAQPAPPPEMEIDPVSLNLHPKPSQLTQREVDDTMHELINIYKRMEKLPEGPQKRQAELGVLAVKRALTGVM